MCWMFNIKFYFRLRTCINFDDDDNDDDDYNDVVDDDDDNDDDDDYDDGSVHDQGVVVII